MFAGARVCQSMAHVIYVTPSRNQLASRNLAARACVRGTITIPYYAPRIECRCRNLVANL